MEKLKLKKKRLNRRKNHIKKKLMVNDGLTRLCISRSNKNFYAQIIDDKQGKTLVGLSTQAKDFPIKDKTNNKEAAAALGKLVAEKALSMGIKKVKFDRNGNLYHGKIKAFADSARENGLEI